MLSALRRSSAQRGLTLVETLIAMGLFGLVLTATYSCLVLALRYQHKTEDATGVFQQALVAMNKMEQSLALASPKSVVIASSPEIGFCFISAAPPSGPLRVHYTPGSGAEVEWQKAVCFYVRKDQGVPILEMKQKPLASPTTSLPATPSVDAMMSDRQLTAVRLARNVTELTVTSDASAELVLRVQGRNKAVNALTLYNRLNFRLH